MSQGFELKVVCLGTGTSHGVPMIGCECAVCTSDDPRDKRTRTSVAVMYDGRTILVDTSPELRLQCLACDINRLDAVLYTHHHADHVTGIDDLRRFNWIMRSAITCYASGQTAAALRKMFGYAFRDNSGSPTSSPRLEITEIDATPFDLFGRTVTPIPLFHGDMPVLGFRIGRFAYCTDCSAIPESSMALLNDLDVLILDALRRTPHPTHFNIEQAVAVAKKIGANRTLFTHIAHEVNHADTDEELPDSMSPAFDGQVVMISP